MVESSLTWQEEMIESSLTWPDPVFLCGVEKRQTEKSGLAVHSLAMHDYACIHIWNVYTHMGHNIVPYAYGISHTRMGRPISV